MSLDSIVERRDDFCGYFMLFDSKGDSVTIQEIKQSKDEDLQKIIKVEARNLKLSPGPCRLLIISDVSMVIRRQTKRVKKNFQHQLVASLTHEVLTPMNPIINVTDSVLSKLFEQFGDVDESQIDSMQSQSSNTNKLFPKKRMNKNFAMQLYGDVRLLWSSAHMLKFMLDSQVTISKITNRQLTLNFRESHAPSLS